MANYFTTTKSGSPAQRSPVIVNEYNSRTMKSYLILESEMSTLSMLNTGATICISIATFFASIAAGLWSNVFVADKPSDLAQKYGSTVQNSSIVIALIFVGFAAWLIRSRGSLVTQIKRESGVN
jgi:uncharacterized membrane protein